MICHQIFWEVPNQKEYHTNRDGKCSTLRTILNIYTKFFFFKKQSSCEVGLINIDK